MFWEVIPNTVAHSVSTVIHQHEFQIKVVRFMTSADYCGEVLN